MKDSNDFLAHALLSNSRNGARLIFNDLQEILQVIRTHLDMDISFISEFTETDRVITHVSSGEPRQYIKPNDSHPLEETYCHKIIKGLLPEIIHDTSLNNITNELQITQQLEIGSYLGVPIRVSDGSIYGSFCCFSHNTDPTLSERDLSLMRVFADLAARQIDQKHNHQRLNEEILARISEILESGKLNIHFQPIIDLSRNIITGYEALSRFETDPYRPPDVWFKEASDVALGELLETTSIKKGLEYLDKFPKDVYISFNTSPEHIASGAISKLFENVPVHRIILEITEHQQVTSYPEFQKTLLQLRNRGLRLAIDDAGAGYATFQHLLELGVDIIKLDISLIRNIDTDTKRQALASALISFAAITHCDVIAEGVETKNELHTLKRLGVTKVQGYYLAHPMPFDEAKDFVPILNY